MHAIFPKKGKKGQKNVKKCNVQNLNKFWKRTGESTCEFLFFNTSFLFLNWSFIHTLVQSCMYLHEKIQQKIMKRIHITRLKNQALDVFVMSLTQSTNIIPRKWSFFPLSLEYKSAADKSQFCKSIYINCELAIPKILETVSGKNIFYQALNYLFCKFSFLTKICDMSIWQFSLQLRCI